MNRSTSHRRPASARCYAGPRTVLDALRFLHAGVQARDLRNPVFSRGGIINLCWKGEIANYAELVVEIQGSTYQWSLRLVRDGYEFHVEESVNRLRPQEPPVQLLDARKGEGWWWSGERGERVVLKHGATMCALAAAAADASFPARHVADFVERWGFFDPNPFLLRRDWTGLDSGRFDPTVEIWGRPFTTSKRLRRTCSSRSSMQPGTFLGCHPQSNPVRRMIVSILSNENRGFSTPCTRWVFPAARSACWL